MTMFGVTLTTRPPHRLGKIDPTQLLFSKNTRLAPDNRENSPDHPLSPVASLIKRLKTTPVHPFQTR